jgi:2-polyprenyl-3-methyl-5-hydroxy-6-metoxy-1,4-benzoquinol methylase
MVEALSRARGRAESIEQAVEGVSRLCTEFEGARGPLGPVAGYVADGRDSFVNVAETVGRYLPPGSRILDFGAGRCLKAAVLTALGYECVAFDDLGDYWHAVEENRERIREFAREVGVEFVSEEAALESLDRPFDMVMLHDVLEHLHDSPRELLAGLLEPVRDGGLLFVTVPNPVNLRKRVGVLHGRTNLPPFAEYYWYPGPWRGHVREYTGDDLAQLARFLALEIEELRSCHHMLAKLPRPARPAYRALSTLAPGLRDTWLLVARKPHDWKPPAVGEDAFRRIFGDRLPPPPAGDEPAGR